MANPPDITVEQFATLLQGRGRLLGLDLGTKTIGLAISDSNWSIASAVKTIRRTKFTADVQEMLEFATAEKVQGLVLGLPLNMDGTEGPRVQATRAFARNLLAHTDLPLIYWDERLSSYTAEQFMLEADVSRKKRAKSIDHMAASIILQGCIDALAESRDRLNN
jgi:putative Holliday junction resolvase